MWGKLRSNLTILSYKTKLGWVLAGQVENQVTRKSLCNLSLNLDIQLQLQRFWKLESYDEANTIVPECEQHFQQTTSRDEQGRFVVSLPLKDSIDKLG